MSVMTTRTKIILLIIALITALATVFAAMYKPKRSNSIVRPVIKIATILPLSGEESHIGMAAMQAIKTSLHQIDGNTRYKYEITYIDKSANTPLPPETKATLNFDIAPDPKVLLTINDEPQTTFTIHTPYQEVADLLKKNLAEKNIKNIGLILLAEGNYRQLAQVISQNLAEKYIIRGGVYQKGQQDFNPLLNMLINNDTEHFIIAGSPQESNNLMQALHDKGINNYQITALFVPDLSQNPEIYNNMLYIGSKAGIYDGYLAATAILALIEGYEKNFQKDTLPTIDTVSQYIHKQKAPKNIISIKANIKEVSNGKIIERKE